ncbi:MATE efflux family protein 1-like, partial [Trifolium medium]|nr:MATE efflux family protein 1-like [Trifolium medium]
CYILCDIVSILSSKARINNNGSKARINNNGCILSGSSSRINNNGCLQIWMATSLLADGLAVAGQAVIASALARRDYNMVIASASRVLQVFQSITLNSI